AQVLVRAACGREPGRLTLEQPSQLEDVVQRPLVEREQQPQRAVERIAVGRDDERAVADGLDQAARLEHPEGLADRGAPGPVQPRQLALRRQRISRLEAPVADLAEQLLGDQLVDLAALDWSGGHELWSDNQADEPYAVTGDLVKKTRSEALLTLLAHRASKCYQAPFGLMV